MASAPQTLIDPPSGSAGDEHSTVDVFPAPLGPSSPKISPFVHFEADAAHRLDGAVALHQIFNDDLRRHSPSTLTEERADGKGRGCHFAAHDKKQYILAMPHPFDAVNKHMFQAHRPIGSLSAVFDAPARWR